MISISLHDVSLSFPILHTGHRSFKKSLIATATGGVIMHEAQSAPSVRALSSVSLNFQSGDRVGLVGHNGAGKSTLLRLIAGIYEPDMGVCDVRGKIVSLLNISLGFNPDLSGKDNIRLRGMYLGLKPKETKDLSESIAEFAELGGFIDFPVRTYSSGMQMRLALSLATLIKPEILLMDEWISAGDAQFMAKAQDRIADFVSGANILVLASHSSETIKKWCNKALYMTHGQITAYGDVDEVLERYQSDHVQEKMTSI